jgi:GH43 family beta-xylosidase
MSEKDTFPNPVPFSDGGRHTNPDPFVLRWCGTYYCYATDARGVKVSVSADLAHWEDRQYALTQPGRHDFWAPAVLYYGGVFYLYYSSNPDGCEDENGEKMQLATAESPLGPFTWRKELFPWFSIDAHPVFWRGALYLFYSVNNWIGCDDEKPGTCILLDRLLAPDRPEGRPVPVILPSLPQEIFQKNRFGDGRDWYTLEGACFVPGVKYSFLLYSANCYTDEHYFVGYAAAENRDDLREMRWQKYPSASAWAPLLRQNDRVEGTGHNTVVTGPDLQEQWIVYHGRDRARPRAEDAEQREMYLSRLAVCGRRLTAEGIGQAQRLPHQPAWYRPELQVSGFAECCDTPNACRQELWFSERPASVGAAFTVYLRRADADNWVGIRIHTGKRQFALVERYRGVERVLAGRALRPGFAPFAAHRLQMQLVGGHYAASLDEESPLTADSRILRGAFALCTQNCRVGFYGVTLAQTVLLYGAELWMLDAFYTLSSGTVSTEGLAGRSLSLCRENGGDAEMCFFFSDGAAAEVLISGRPALPLAFPESGGAIRIRCAQGQVCVWQDGRPCLEGGGTLAGLNLKSGYLCAYTETKL